MRIVNNQNNITTRTQSDTKTKQQILSKVNSRIQARHQEVLKSETPIKLDQDLLLKQELFEKKIQIYAKLEAKECIEEEFQRRQTEQTQQQKMAKKLIQSKIHKIITDDNLKSIPPLSIPYNIINNLEQSYRNSLITAARSINDSYQCNQNINTSFSANTSPLKQIKISDISQSISSQKNSDRQLRKGISLKTPSSIKYSRTPMIMTLSSPQNSKLPLPASEIKDRPTTQQQNLRKIASQKKDSRFIQKVKKDHENQAKSNQNIMKSIEFLQTTPVTQKLNSEAESGLGSIHETKSFQNADKTTIASKVNKPVSGLAIKRLPTSSHKKSISSFASPMVSSRISTGGVKSNNNNVPTQLNINTQLLKDIIMKTTTSQLKSSSAMNTLRKEQPGRSSAKDQKECTKVELENLRFQIEQSLKGIDQNTIQQVLDVSQENQSGYQVIYLTNLILAIVDPSIQLNEDQNDLENTGFLSMQFKIQQLFNEQSSKLKSIVDNSDYQELANKLDVIRKYEQNFEILHQCSEPLKPLLKLIQTIVQTLKQIRDSSDSVFNGKRNAFYSQQNSRLQSPHSDQILKTKQTNQQPVSCENYLQYYSTKATPFSNASTAHTNKSKPKLLSHDQSNLSKTSSTSFMVNHQLIQERQKSIDLSYQQVLKQSLQRREQELLAKQKQLQLNQMKIQKNSLLAQLNREDRLVKLQKEQEEEQEYIKSQIEFRQRMSSEDRYALDQEKSRMRELSIENQRYKQQVKNMQKEEELRLAAEEQQKSLHELQWKEKQLRKQKIEKAIEHKQKEQLILKSKISITEKFKQEKSVEAEARLRQSMETISTKFKEIEEQEKALKKELQVLMSMKEVRVSGHGKKSEL